MKLYFGIFGCIWVKSHADFRQLCLKRNLKISNQDTKSAAYFSLVRPNLEYCASIWNPYSIQSIKKLKMVQRRAARYATNRYRNTSSVTDMLDNLEWETLESRRTKIQLVMFFKIINDLVDIPSSSYLIPANNKRRSNHSKKMQQYHTRSDFSSTVSFLEPPETGISH